MIQCKFIDRENGEIHGGIIDNEGNIICGGCGGLIEADEIGEDDSCTHSILKRYNKWVNLDREIIDE